VWNAETQAEIIPHKDDSKKETISSYKLDISPEYFANKQEEADRATDQKRKEMYHMVAELMQGPAYSEPEEKEETPWGFDTENIKVVGQIFESYVIAQSGDTMIIADQHAAHERLKYEALKKDLESKQVTPQILMFPIICDLTPAEYVCYMENEQEIAQMGFETESFGTNSVLIRATPEAFDEDDLKQVFVEILDNFAENKTSVITAKMERALYTIACKAAVKANHKFDTVQLEKLLKEVFTLKGINTWPHGRPIIITMTKKELEKDFKRLLQYS
jgi:DNA mismatch repair ATPase MutL